MRPSKRRGAPSAPLCQSVLVCLALFAGLTLPAAAQEAATGEPAPSVESGSAAETQAAEQSDATAAGPIILTLADTVQMALESNLDLRLAELAVKEAQAAVDEARAPGRVQVSVSGGYTRMGPTASMTMPLGEDGEDVEVQISGDTNHAYELRAYKSLNSAGRNRALRTLAELNVDVKGLQAEAARRQIALAATNLFYTIARAEAFVNVRLENLESAREHWRLARARYEADAVPRVDVMRAEVEVANAEQDLISAETAVETAKTVLKTLLRIDVTREVVLDAVPDPAPLSVDSQACLDLALARREELAAAARAIRMAEVSADLARAANGFQFGLTGIYNQSVEGGGLGGGSSSWSVTLGVSKTLIDGGAADSQVEQAMVQREQAETNVARLRDDISDEVWQAYLGMTEAATKLVSTAKTIELAEESLRIVEVQYEAGLATPVNVTDARAALMAARTNHVNAIYAYQIAEAELLSAVNISDPTLIARQSESIEPGSEQH